MQRVSNKKRLDASKYINKETGELLVSEIAGITSVNTTKSDRIIVSSTEYMILDSSVLEYLRTRLTPQDMGRVVVMANMLRTDFNVLFDSTTNLAHDEISLQKELDYTRNRFRDFMRKLYLESIISYWITRKNGKDVTYILMNPYLARKRKVFHKDVLALFHELKPTK